MEWGDKLDFLRDIEKDTGKRPAALDRRVTPDHGNAFFWKAFQTLSKARRPSSGGLADILLPDIVAYADLHGVRDIDLRAQLCRVIIAMDGAFLEWVRAQKPQ